MSGTASGFLLTTSGSLMMTAGGGPLASGVGSVAGVVLIAGGDAVDITTPVTSATSLFAFADATPGNTLRIDDPASFAGDIIGFGAGDTITLGVPLAVATIAYDRSTGVLALENSGSTILASVLLGSGNFAPGTYTVDSVTGIAGVSGFTIDTVGDDTVLTTNVAGHVYDNSSGTWQSALHWSNGTPGPLDTAVIPDIADSTPFTETTGATPVSVGALELLAPECLLEITSNTTVTPYGICQTAGTLEVTPGNTLQASRFFDFGGTVKVYADASLAVPTLDLANQGTADIFDFTGTIDFQDATGTLKLEQPGLYGGTVAGLSHASPGTHDIIDLLNTAAHTIDPYVGTTLGGTLTIREGTTFAAAITLAGDYTQAHFHLASDLNSGTDVYVSCFLAGTRIATPDGEMPVERLRIGQALRTASGAMRPVRWVGRRRHAARVVVANPQLRPVRIATGALGAGVPARDLLVSPLHGLMVNGILVAAGALVNGTTIRRAPPDVVDYFHIELENHDLLLAEGAAAESFCDQDSRAMFENAAEFAALYPGTIAQAPRIARTEHGPAFERVLARLAPSRPSSGKLRGHVERILDGVVEGWAMDAGDPLARVRLEIAAPGLASLFVMAGQYRLDLDRAGLAEGCCGFRAALPDGAPTPRVRRAQDGAPLPMARATSVRMESSERIKLLVETKI